MGGWIYLEIDLVLHIVDKLHLIPKRNWTEICLAYKFADSV